MFVLLVFTACSRLQSANPVAPPATLSARVSFAEGRITVNNDSAAEWSTVVATPADGVDCNLGIIHPHDQGSMALTNCSNGGPKAPISQVRVAADQGQLVIALQPPVDPGVAPPLPAPVVPEAAPAQAAAPHASASAPAQVAASPTVEAPKAEIPPLRISARVSGGFGPARRLNVTNDGSSAWTGCSLTLADHYHYQMKTLNAGKTEGIMLVRFKDSAGNVYTSNGQIKDLRVSCDQGKATVSPD